MTRTTKMFFLFVLFSFISIKGFSQLSISYYSSSLSKIGMGYDFNDKLRSELRLYSNISIYNLIPELVVCYNIVKKERYNVYLGLGANFNYETYYGGFVFPAGVQFTPIENFDRFSLHIELQPTYGIVDDLIIQSSWGLRYKF